MKEQGIRISRVERWERDRGDVCRLARRQGSGFVGETKGGGAVERTELEQAGGVELGVTRSQEEEFVPQAEIRIRRAAVGTEGNVDAARKHVAPRVGGVSEIRMRARAIDDGDVWARCEKIELDRGEIIAVDDEGAIEFFERSQIVERAAAARNGVRLPNAEFLEEVDKLSGAVGEQLEFRTRLGEMHGERRAKFRGEIDDRVK